MVKLTSQEVSHCVVASLFEHVNRIKPEHRPRVVLIFMTRQLVKYCFATGIKTEQVKMELSSYALSQSDKPLLDDDEAFEDFKHRCERAEELYTGIPEEDLQVAVFLTLSRLSLIHSTFSQSSLDEIFDQMYSVLDESDKHFKEAVKDACAADVSDLWYFL